MRHIRDVTDIQQLLPTETTTTTASPTISKNVSNTQSMNTNTTQQTVSKQPPDPMKKEANENTSESVGSTSKLEQALLGVNGTGQRKNVLPQNVTTTTTITTVRPPRVSEPINTMGDLSNTNNEAYNDPIEELVKNIDVATGSETDEEKIAAQHNLTVTNRNVI